MLKSRKQVQRNYILKQLPSSTALVDTEFILVDASDKWLEQFGFSSSLVFGSTVFELFGSAIEKRRHILENCFRGVKGKTIIDTHVKRDENQVRIEWQFLPWYDEDENIIGLIMQSEDVTQKIKDGQNPKKIGVSQKNSTDFTGDLHPIDDGRLFRTLMNHLPLNVFIKDIHSKKIFVNKAECEYVGAKTPSELIGKSDFDLYPEDVAQISRDEDLAVMNSLEPILGRETISRRKNGIATTFLTSKIPFIEEDGTVQGVIGISLDISELKQKEQELRDLINMTSLQNKKLVDFAHIISHNLRSHAANFAMLLEFLRTERDEKEKIQLVEMLNDASENLLETIDNLNEVVAINTNTSLDKKSVSVAKTIRRILADFSDLLKTNNASVECQIAEEIRVNVVPDYLDGIITNFISNSIKYKDPNRPPVIKLSTRRINDHVVLSIEDNGLGIDLSIYGDKLFGMHKTFHNNKDARGIGLYIAKNQIEAMNGKVAVESKVGVGTKFEIYFDRKN